MRKALNISESGYYRWLKNKDKSTKQQLLLVEIRKILKEYPDNDNYGSRRMHTALAQRGIHVSVRTVVPKTLDIAGDGTCIKTKASPVGRRVCNCKDNGVFNCPCGRRFSDPNAAWGWDSSKEVYFYGYMGYFLSTYNNDLKLDFHYTLGSLTREETIAFLRWSLCRNFVSCIPILRWTPSYPMFPWLLKIIPMPWRSAA